MKVRRESPTPWTLPLRHRLPPPHHHLRSSSQHRLQPPTPRLQPRPPLGARVLQGKPQCLRWGCGLEASDIEARGFDGEKLVGFGNNRTYKIVARIVDEQVEHLAIGVYWFAYVYQKLNCAPDSTFKGCET
ncbi:hypothetical protein VNO78_12243 [Psophocarpus tetragonolobus]|uniref:Uncharacterized protein n=1 Tax=Psophocarpus tetragonolobus TaxID=3891 RepID=A0AAN9SMN1_PSOTE